MSNSLLTANFSGRLLIEVKNGKIVRADPVPDGHIVTSTDQVKQLLEKHGYKVYPDSLPVK